MAEIDKLIEDVGRLYEKLEGLQKRQDQFTEQQGKLLEQYGKRFEDMSALLNRRIDDTNAWFDGIQKLLELMVQAEIAKLKDN
ncbi:MAG: hypothetical protein K0Q60_3889 [Microvirga sp.]|jgi:DNA-binding transcriptional regulator GbsR (MarR family)|nr:hypothetical protein [Microvirga sp.]